MVAATESRMGGGGARGWELGGWSGSRLDVVYDADARAGCEVVLFGFSRAHLREAAKGGERRAQKESDRLPHRESTCLSSSDQRQNNIDDLRELTQGAIARGSAPLEPLCFSGSGPLAPAR